MCENQKHDKVTGVKAVELLEEARLLNNVCSSRMRYLEIKTNSFYEWLDKQDWCEDAVLFCEQVRERVRKELDPDADTCAEYVLENDVATASEQLEMEFDGYENELMRLADQGARKAHSLKWKIQSLEENLERWREELKLHDKIQDALDQFKPGQMTVKRYTKYRERLDWRKRLHQLRYDGWILFTNQLNELMGYSLIKPRWMSESVADKIARGEKRLVALNKEYEERPEFFSDPHKEADEWIEAHEQQVLQAGLAEMQQAYLCAMCGVEWIPGHKGCTCS